MRYAVFLRAINLYCCLEKMPKGTALGGWLERHLKVKTTTRYWRVVQQVHQRMD